MVGVKAEDKSEGTLNNGAEAGVGPKTPLLFLLAAIHPSR